MRRAGYNPVPHVAAREMASHEALDDFLARLRGEADVTRILLISGRYRARPGPLQIEPSICASGLIERRGFARLSVAGHPEGHPYMEAAEMFAVLEAWREWGRGCEIQVDVITQFCFESGPILGLIGDSTGGTSGSRSSSGSPARRLQPR